MDRRNKIYNWMATKLLRTVSNCGSDPPPFFTSQSDKGIGVYHPNSSLTLRVF